MKIVNYLACCFLLVACKSPDKKVVADSLAVTDSVVVNADTAVKATEQKAIDTVFHPYKLIDDFVVTDTEYYDFTLGSSVYLVINRNNKLVDTIDKYNGLRKLPDSTYLYQVVRTWPLSKDASPALGYKNSRSGSNVEYILLKRTQKLRLDSLAPTFNYYFSSPEIINGKIYFWKIVDDKKNESYKISAAQFDIKNTATKAHYLFADEMGTDDEGYLPPPYLENGQIIFYFNNDKIWKFSEMSFQAIK